MSSCCSPSGTSLVISGDVLFPGSITSLIKSELSRLGSSSPPSCSFHCPSSSPSFLPYGGSRFPEMMMFPHVLSPYTSFGLSSYDHIGLLTPLEVWIPMGFVEFVVFQITLPPGFTASGKVSPLVLSGWVSLNP